MSNKILLIPLLTVILFVGYFFSRSKPCGATCNPQPVSVSASQFQELSKKDDVILVDVRTPEEFTSGHIEGAVNLNFNEKNTFEASLGKLDKNKTYLVYCRSGNRSGQAVALMQTKGFTSLTNLSGGIQSWQSAGFPLQNN